MAFKYRKGERIVEEYPLDSTSADILVGDAITASGATSGYFKEVDALAEAIVGIAVSKVSSPSADGGAVVLVDVSELSVYEVTPDAGSVGVTLVAKTMDAGADARSADINGSTTDDLLCVRVDEDANTLYVMLRKQPAGVI